MICILSQIKYKNTRWAYLFATEVSVNPDPIKEKIL